MKSRHLNIGCNQGRIGDESMLISRAILLGVWRWLRREIASTTREQWLAAVFCVVAVAVVWFGRNL